MDHHEHGGKGQDTHVYERITPRPSREAVCKHPLPNPPPYVGEDAPDQPMVKATATQQPFILLDTD